MTDQNNMGGSGVFRDDEIDKKSSTGLDNNVAGLLTYSLGFITGILFLVIEKDSQFVRYHAMQSIFIWLFLFIVSMVIGFIPFIGWIFSLLFAPVAFVIWIFCMLKAYQGKKFKFPVAGDIAEQQINNMKN